MALVGFDYNTKIQDIVWDSSTSTPLQVTSEVKIVRDLIEILYVLTDITTLPGRPNMNTLSKVQNYSAQAMSILSNRQATQIGLDPSEQIVNLNFSGIQPTLQSPREFDWVVLVTTKNNNTIQIII